MPYRSLLEQLVGTVPGAQGAVLMDRDGEVVVEAGEDHGRHRLIGAYQAITLARLRNTAERSGTGAIRHVHSRYSDGHVILRPLKDGYYIVLSLARNARVGPALHRSADTQDRMNAEL